MAVQYIGEGIEFAHQNKSNEVNGFNAAAGEMSS